MHKKLALTATLLCLLTTAPVYAAHVVIEPVVNIGAVPAPVYVAPPPPAPVYVGPYPTYYEPYHHHRDWRYWEERRAHERWEREHRY